MIEKNLMFINESIEKIKQLYGIKYNIDLLAVSKTYPVEAVYEALNAGQFLFGENRVIEAYKKFTDPLVKDNNIKLHIIGHLQRNKAKEAVFIADTIQSIDKVETLLEIEKQALNINKNINYLIEVNTTNESQKSGVSPDILFDFLEKIDKLSLKNCKLKGLMTVGPLTEDKLEIKNSFSLLKKLFDKTSNQINNLDFNVLSMGMSNDFDIAIGEGSNFLRIGSAIFGRRS